MQAACGTRLGPDEVSASRPRVRRCRAALARAGATLALVIIAGTGSFGQPGGSPGQEVAIACSSAVEAALLDIRGEFQQRTGHGLRISCALAASVVERVRAGDSFDIVILPPSAIDSLAAAGRVAPASRRMVGRSPLALAQKAGQAARPTQTVDALRSVIGASPSIAFAREGLSGRMFTTLLQQWGVAESLAPKLRPMDSGAAVTAAVARGDADLGVLPASEIVSVPGLEVAGVFPPGLDAFVVMEAAAAADRANAAPVKAFIAFLSDPAWIRTLRRQGFETVDSPRPPAFGAQ